MSYKEFYRPRTVCNSLAKKLNQVYAFKSNESFKSIDFRLEDNRSIPDYKKDKEYRSIFPSAEGVIHKHFTKLGDIQVRFGVYSNNFIHTEIAVSSLEKHYFESWSCKRDMVFSRFLYMLEYLTSQVLPVLLVRKNIFSDFSLSKLR